MGAGTPIAAQPRPELDVCDLDDQIPGTVVLCLVETPGREGEGLTSSLPSGTPMRLPWGHIRAS